MKSKKKILLSVAAITAVLVIAFALLPERRAIHWSENARQMYSIIWRTVIQMSPPGGKMIQETLELHGTLNFRIFSLEGDKIKSGFQLYPLTIRKSGMENADAREIYTLPFLADISRDGKFIDFNFSNEIAVEDEKSLEDILRTFQLIIKGGIFSKWQTNEDDSNGSYIAEYEENEHSVKKGKKSYTELINKDGFLRENETVDIKRSNYIFSYDNNSSWLNKAEGNELLVFYHEGSQFLKISSTFKLNNIPFNPDRDLALWQDKFDPDQILTRWNRGNKNTTPLARKSEIDSLKQKFGRETLSQVADRLFKMHYDFDTNCLRTLMEYLTLYPDSASKIPDYLLSKELNPTQRITLVHALERTGSREAQEALITIMNGQDFKKESRTQAAIGLGSIEKPTDNALSGLWDAYDKRGSSNNLENADHIAATAILSLGAIAKNLEASTSRDYRDISYEIKEKISSDLSGSPELNTKVALLHAAGNTADEDLVDDITGHFSDSNPRVRSAAVNSLAYMDDAVVNDLLIIELDNESNINVRNSMIRTMYRKEASEETVGKIIELAPLEENEMVRGEMYRYLLKNREFPGVKTALKNMLKNEKSYEHKKIIRTALSTKKKSPGNKG